ncbi:MAG TPA: hypothetical protein VNL70_01210 [Tepidisphaeraceae bacterium]|nr:hypothetical protein [Tepidisphaeraceae bacterium]
MIELHEQDHSVWRIARKLEIDRGTVGRFIDAGTLSERATRPYPNRGDWLESYLRRRCDVTPP